MLLNSKIEKKNRKVFVINNRLQKLMKKLVLQEDLEDLLQKYYLEK